MNGYAAQRAKEKYNFCEKDTPYGEIRFGVLFCIDYFMCDCEGAAAKQFRMKIVCTLLGNMTLNEDREKLHAID